MTYYVFKSQKQQYISTFPSSNWPNFCGMSWYDSIHHRINLVLPYRDPSYKLIRADWGYILWESVLRISKGKFKTWRLYLEGLSFACWGILKPLHSETCLQGSKFRKYQIYWWKLICSKFIVYSITYVLHKTKVLLGKLIPSPMQPEKNLIWGSFLTGSSMAHQDTTTRTWSSASSFFYLRRMCVIEIYYPFTSISIPQLDRATVMAWFPSPLCTSV